MRPSLSSVARNPARHENLHSAASQTVAMGSLAITSLLSGEVAGIVFEPPRSTRQSRFLWR